MCLYLSYGCRLDDARLTHRIGELAVATVVPHLDEKGIKTRCYQPFGPDATVMINTKRIYWNQRIG
jgi:hypothetical protein